jgi:CDP-diacylglycerol--glycerol-3-phosphate 3-phosphatidyltransferase
MHPDTLLEMEQPEPKTDIWSTPNLLTGLRIALVPVVVVLLLFPGRLTSFLGGLCFLLAGATDFLDGFLARRHRLVSRFGKFLDPLADKLLVSAALIMLIPLGRVPAWMAFLIVGRELAVTGLRGLAASEGIILAADRWGKAKTALQMLAVTALIFHYPFLSINFQGLGLVLLWLALITTLASGAGYFQAFFRQTTARPTS